MKRAVDAVMSALVRHRGDPIDLLVGEPCFAPPTEILSAFERIADEAIGGYGPPAGLNGLRRVLVEWEGGVGAGPDNVVVTHGAKGGLLALFAALIAPGDEVIHPLPCYPAYPAIVRRLGGDPLGVSETDDGFTGWSAAVMAVMGPKVKAVVLASPSNPSGATISREDLVTLIGICRDRGVRVILDEAYSAFRFSDGVNPCHVLGPDDTLVRIGSASKGLALCGWRMGWVVADEKLAARVTGAQAALLNPPATPPQRALLALPDVPVDYFETNRRTVHLRLETLAKAMNDADFTATMPAGGFYLWVDISDRLGGTTSADWCERLAEEAGVGFWPGEDFGAPGWVRLALPRGDCWRSDVAGLERRLSP